MNQVQILDITPLPNVTGFIYLFIYLFSEIIDAEIFQSVKSLQKCFIAFPCSGHV